MADPLPVNETFSAMPTPVESVWPDHQIELSLLEENVCTKYLFELYCSSYDYNDLCWCCSYWGWQWQSLLSSRRWCSSETRHWGTIKNSSSSSCCQTSPVQAMIKTGYQRPKWGNSYWLEVLQPRVGGCHPEEGTKEWILGWCKTDSQVFKQRHKIKRHSAS